MARSRNEMAQRAAQELEDGFYVNRVLDCRPWSPTIFQNRSMSGSSLKTVYWGLGSFRLKKRWMLI